MVKVVKHEHVHPSYERPLGATRSRRDTKMNEDDEYWFIGQWKNPRDGKSSEVVAPVKASNLNEFLTRDVAVHRYDPVRVIDKMEGGNFLADPRDITWTHIETRKAQKA